MIKRTCLFFAVGLCLAVSPPSLAKVVELPHQRALEVQKLRIELADAEIAIEVSKETAPSLRLTALAKAADGSPLASQLELTAEAGGWKLTRPAAAAGEAPRRVRIEVYLSADQLLEVQGENLDIVAQNPARADPSGVRDDEDDEDDEDRPDSRDSEEDDSERDDLEKDESEEEAAEEGASGEIGQSKPLEVAPPAAAEAPHTYRFQLAASQLNVVALEGIEVEADDSWVRLDRTSGALQLTANNGSLTIEQHRGSLDLLATDGEISFSSIFGQTQADLLGGSLVAQGGNGQITVKSEDTSLRLVGHRGMSSLQGIRSTIDVRELGTFGRASVDSQDSQVTLAESSGTFFIQQNGGSLDGRNLRGSFQLSARANATIELADVDGKVTLEGQEARFVLARLPRMVDVTLNQSTLDLQEVGFLTVQGRASEITGRNIATLRKFEVVESTVNLDLSKLQGRVAVRLSGDSDAEIELAAPCVVHVVGGNASERVDVSGCHLQAAELSGARNAHISRNLRPSTTLAVTLDGDVSVSVRGR